MLFPLDGRLPLLLPSLAAALLACGRAPSGASPVGSAPVAVAEPASLARVPTGFHCFAWVHGPEAFSTDCYRSAEACETEREAMHGVLTRACEPAPHASCTVLAPGGPERCFADERACGRYRAMITSRNIESGPCEAR